MLNIVDLFYGTGSSTKAFQDRGHRIVSVDFDSKFNPTICADILDVGIEYFEQRFNEIDFIWASPPCNRFSVAAFGSNWMSGYRPAHTDTLKALQIAYHTLWLIKSLNPMYYVIENPVGLLRKMPGFNRPKTITLCQYGDTRMKPTDLFGRLPPEFIPRRCNNGDSCHEQAPRGSKTGTQGLRDSEKRAMMPYNLSFELCLAVEKGSERKRDTTLEEW